MRIAKKRRLLMLLTSLIWMALILIWSLSGSNKQSLDSLSHLIATLHATAFATSFGIPFIVILPLLVVNQLTIQELQRLTTAHLLRQFIIRTSLSVTGIISVGCLFSFCILAIIRAQQVITMSHILGNFLLLVLYWLGSFILYLVIITISICTKKFTALVYIVGFLILDNLLLYVFGINIFLHRGLMLTSSNYDYQVLLNLLLYVFYIVLITNHIDTLFKKKYSR